MVQKTVLRTGSGINDAGRGQCVLEQAEVARCVEVLDFAEVEVGEGAPKNAVKVFLSQCGGTPEGNYRSFCTDKALKYCALCDDFGPMNILSIMQFVQTLDDEVAKSVHDSCDQLVYVAGKGWRDFTNAAFLLGAYMILKLNRSPQDVDERFHVLTPLAFEGYRDATFSPADFRLRLIDCWEGLARGKAMGWVAMPTSSSSSVWGQIDKDVYAHYDDPLNADLNEVVPGRFIAFRGPKHLGGPTYRNDYIRHSRDFDPKYYLDIFEEHKVSAVIRLNEATYDAQAFEHRGIAHHDLYFNDCTAPPPGLVQKFTQIADAAKGTIAIHCKAGLGRTGTLIGIHMMSAYGFTAREAMGWLRIMRPGSVIGVQQHFLCAVDAGLRARAAAGRLPSNPASAEAWAKRAASPPPPADGPADACAAVGAGDAATLAAQVAEGVGRRDCARVGWAAELATAAPAREPRRNASR